MTTSSRDVDSRSGQVSPSGATAMIAAGALMLTSALLTFFIGAFALAADDLVVSGPGYEYTFQMTGWGWANMLTGVVLAAAVAIALLASAQWARAAAIIVTCLAIVLTFLWMPYYPTGSIVLISLDVVVIWGVATWNTAGKTA